jgi:hypothetical protein
MTSCGLRATWQAQILALVILALIWGLIALPNCDSLDAKFEKKSVDDSSSGWSAVKETSRAALKYMGKPVKGRVLYWQQPTLEIR